MPKSQKPQRAASQSVAVARRGRPAAKAKAKAKTPKADLSPAQRNELIIEHYESAKRLGWSFLNRWRARIEEDEVNSIVGAALCEAANRFNSKLGVGFRTFLFYYLRGMLLKEITKRISDNKSSAAMEPTEGTYRLLPEAYPGSTWPYVFVEHENPETLLEKDQVTNICRKACQALDPLEQEVLRRFFVDEQSVVEIARDLGYCRCHISRVKSRALSLLQKSLGGLVTPDEGEEGSADKLRHRLRLNRYRGGRGRRTPGAVHEASSIKTAVAA